MKILIGFVLCVSLFMVNAYPADPSDDVELIPPKNTNSRTNADGESFDDDDDEEQPVGGEEIPVIIIRSRPTFGSHRPSFIDPSTFFDRNSGFGFGSGFPFRRFPFSGNGGDDFFGVDSDDERRTSTKSETEKTEDDDDDESTLPCGFLCNILRGLEEHVNKLENDFKDMLANKNNKTSEGKDGYDVYNETYTEKTLADGSVVKINRTVISDTSDDGNSFFFHSTSFHNPGFGAEYGDEEEEEIEHEFSDKNNNNKDKEVPTIGDDEKNSEESFSSTSSTTTTTESAADTGLVPRIEDDESFNEVLGDVSKKNNVDNVDKRNDTKGIDDGLVGATH